MLTTAKFFVETDFQFLFANCQSTSSHFVAVHSWVCAATEDHKKNNKNPLFC